MFFPEQLLRAKSQQVHTLPLSVITVWSRKWLYRTFICFKVVLQEMNCVFYTVKMEHSRHSCHPHIGINQHRGTALDSFFDKLSFFLNPITYWFDFKQKRQTWNGESTKNTSSKGIVLKLAKEKQNLNIYIYKFYDLGQHIFLFYTVPSNSYQQDILEEKVFSLFWSCVNVYFMEARHSRGSPGLHSSGIVCFSPGPFPCPWALSFTVWEY